jgi:hypothetical protein
MADPNSKPWTSQDEENLLLEISEDRRLRRLGIDPDADQLTILIEVKKRMREIEEERARKRQESKPYAYFA